MRKVPETIKYKKEDNKTQQVTYTKTISMKCLKRYFLITFPLYTTKHLKGKQNKKNNNLLNEQQSDAFATKTEIGTGMNFKKICKKQKSILELKR